MDYTCFNWVQIVKKSELPSNAKYLALYLATFMNAEHDIAWPSMARISHETGLSKMTCRKWLDYLHENDWLTKTRNTHFVTGSGGTQRHNEYAVRLPETVVRGAIGYLPLSGRGANHLPKGGKPFAPNNNINNNKTKDICENLPVSTRCPVQEIVKKYHLILPELPKIQKLTKNRESYIRQRWREDLTDLDQWENYFNFVRQSDFLMGRTEPRPGHRVFRADLDFLIKPSSFTKIAEEKYHG